MSRIASLATLASTKGGQGEAGSCASNDATPSMSAAAASVEHKPIGVNTFVRRMKDDYDVK